MTINEYYCINLYGRDDRLLEAKTVFEKYDLPVKFYRVNKDPENGARGCFNSHVGIIKEAFSKNLENVLIFEDDITCHLTKEEFDIKMKKVYNFIEKYNYDIFFLGSLPQIIDKSVVKVIDNIYKVNTILTHSYILSRSGINKYKDLVYTNIPIDFIYKESNKSYAIYPSIFYQSESKSDIAPPWFMCFGLKNSSMKLLEQYAMHINVPLRVPLKIIIIISLVLFIMTRKIIFLVVPIIFFCYYLLKY
jgi:GR25 family glycosyltransferase involved in LPS biosynthesis